jgi:hypothetical protein
MEGSKRPTIGFEAAVVVLVALLITAFALIVSMAVRPSAIPAAAEAITDKNPVRCGQQGALNATCFDTTVTNTGGAGSSFQCDIIATDTSQALFPGGSTNTEVLLQPDQSVHVTSSVIPPTGAKAQPPYVTCTPFST